MFIYKKTRERHNIDASSQNKHHTMFQTYIFQKKKRKEKKKRGQKFKRAITFMFQNPNINPNN